jgi:hypothetical protein
LVTVTLFGDTFSVNSTPFSAGFLIKSSFAKSNKNLRILLTWLWLRHQLSTLPVLVLVNMKPIAIEVTRITKPKT